MWKGDEVGNWYEFIGINWSLGSVLGNYFLSSFWNYMMQNGGFRHKPNTVNCFNCLWSDIKQELWEQFKFFAVWLKSDILWNHWWLNWSVTLADENNPVLFWDKRKLIEFIASFLKMQSVKNTCVHINCFLFFPRQKIDRDLYSHVIRYKQEKPCTHTIIATQCKYYRATVSQNVI